MHTRKFLGALGENDIELPKIVVVGDQFIRKK